MKKNFFAMTLVELIIAITISSIVLLFVVVYISDVLGLIGESRKATSNFVELKNISEDFQDLKARFPNATINNSAWSEALILKNIEDNDGVVIGVVNAESMILANAWDLSAYWKKYLAIRYLQSSDSPLDINKSFSGSQYFENIVAQSVDFEIYTIGTKSIVEADFSFIKNYSSQRDSENISNMNQSNFQNYNFSF